MLIRINFPNLEYVKNNSLYMFREQNTKIVMAIYIYECFVYICIHICKLLIIYLYDISCSSGILQDFMIIMT